MKTIYIIYHLSDFWIVTDKTIVGMFYDDEAACGAEAIARTAARGLIASGQEAKILSLDLTALIDQTMEAQHMEYDDETLVLEWLVKNQADLALSGGKPVEVYPRIFIPKGVNELMYWHSAR